MSSRTPARAQTSVTSYLLIAVVVAPWAIALLAPRVLEGFAVPVAAAIAVIAAAAYGLLRPKEVSRGALTLVALSGAAVAVACLAAALSLNPRVSFAGMFGVGDSTQMWLLAWATFAVFALISDARSRKGAIIAISVMASVAAVSGLLDFAGAIQHGDPWSTEASGLLATSNALAQALLLGVASSLSWWLMRPKSSAWPLAAAALCSLALALSSSRAALVSAVVIGGLAALAAYAGPLSRGRKVALAAIVAVPAIVAAAVMGLAFAGGMGGGLADRILSDRPALWHSALTQVAQHPLLGSGMRTFSAIYSWTPDATRISGADTIGSFSPHSALLDWLAGAGLVGTLLVLATVAAVVPVAWSALRSADRRSPLWPLAAGLVAFAVTSLVSIVDVVALLSFAALLGTFVSGATERDTKESALSSRIALGVAAVAGVAVVALLAVPLTVAARWPDNVTADPTTVDAVLEAYERTGDPSYLVQGLTALISITNEDYPDELASDAHRLATEALPDARWNIDAARLSATALALRSTLSPEQQHAEVAEALDAGREADPTSSVWDYYAARDAAKRGLDEIARANASAALEDPTLTERARLALMRLAR